MNANEIVEHWVEQIQRITPGDFTPIPDFASFVSRARTESIYWCETFLSQRANPHSLAGGVSHSYHPAGPVNLDLLRHEYAVAGQPLTVFEGVNFVIVEWPVRKEGAWAKESIEAAIRLSLILLDARRHWVFQYPSLLAEGTLISTAPGVDPAMMYSWSERADVLLRHGRLYIICFKRYPPNQGFLHDAQWFETDLRSKSRR